jgi:TrmH family RNA methyltransferase
MMDELKPIKWYASLNTGKARRETGLFLLEGERSINQVNNVSPYAIQELLLLEDNDCQFCDIPTRTLTRKQMREVSESVTLPKIVAVVRIPSSCYSDDLPENCGKRILLLEDVQDPGNCGTLIRTAAAFGYDGIVMSDKCADPFSHKCLQSSAGTVLSLWIRRTSDYLGLIGKLKEKEYKLISSDMDGTPVSSETFAEPFILAMCNEGNGMTEELKSVSDEIVSLVIDRSRAESLNVAMCGSIFMYLSAV